MAQDFTVDRALSKWVLGDAGVLVEYAADEPAIEFNADGSYKGVLVEPAGTNEAVGSEDLDNGTYWLPVRTTIAGDTETDPKGGTNSFLLAETTAIGDHFFFTQSAYRASITSGETWTQSVYLKKGSGANAPDIVQLTYSASTHSATQYANFNISTGTLGNSSGGTATIQDAGNGWYRCSWTATATFTAAQGSVFVVFTNNIDTLVRRPTYTGQADADVFVWGAQLEESPIATSYIPTTTGSVTRVKDDIYLTSASSLIGQTEGTLFVEVDWRSSDKTSRLIDVSDGSIVNNIVITNDTVSSAYAISLRANNSIVVSESKSNTSLSGTVKFAFAYKTADSKLFVNGSEELSDTTNTFTFTAQLNEISFGQRKNSSEQANLWIRAVALFTTRLSDAECQALTT